MEEKEITVENRLKDGLKGPAPEGHADDEQRNSHRETVKIPPLNVRMRTITG